MTISNRAWTLGAVLLIAVILVAAWFIGISPVLAQAGGSASERAEVVTQNALQETRLSSLKERFASIDGLRAELDEQQKLVPASAQIPRFLGQVDRIRATSGVVITDVSVLDGVPYEAPAEEAPVEGEAGDATAEAEVPAEGAEAAAISSDAEEPQPGALSGADFIAVPISITASGSFTQVMDFVSGLQGGERLFLVTDLAVAEDTEPAVFTGDVSGFIYVLVDDAVDGAGTEPPGETTTASTD